MTPLKEILWRMAVLLLASCCPLAVDPQSSLPALDVSSSAISPQAGSISPATQLFACPEEPFETLPSEVHQTVSFSFVSGQCVLKEVEALCRQIGIQFFARSPKRVLFWQERFKGQKPFRQLLDELCSGQGWRYRFVGKTLYLETDTPYLHTHLIPFPLGGRQAHSHLQLSTDLGNSFPGSAGGNQPQTLLSSKMEVDFWGELEKTLTLILQVSSPSPCPSTFQGLSPARRSPPDISVSPPSTQAPSPSRPSLPEGRAKSPHAQEASLPLPPKRTTLLWIPPQQGKPTEPSTLPSPSLSPASPSWISRPPTSFFALHKQAGVVSVYGTKHQQRLIHEYLQRIKRLTHIQVTVEAHILEILLKKKYQWGVDWQVLGRRWEGAGIVGMANKLPGLVSLRLKTSGFKALLGALGEFGHVRTLSNPRLTVLNNQPALMKVVKGEVFFRLEVDRILSSNAKPDLETTTSHMQTIPIGLMMVVQPSVDQSTGEVLLSLRPTVSRVVELRDDPAVSLRSENKVQSKIPVVQTRELDSVLRVRPQETVLMGGLMETTQENSRRGLGPLQQLPVVGNLFGSQEESSCLCELVILLRVWVDQGAAPADLPPHPLPGPTART